jgi:hypothetical protein
VRVKRYEHNGKASRPSSLSPALTDFQCAREADPNHDKALAAIEKISKLLRGRRKLESIMDRLGPPLIAAAGLFVFVLAQLAFVLPRTVLDGARIDYTPYGALTFGALAFIVAGLSLPKLLKLKVPGIELQKSAADQVSAPSTLGIATLGQTRAS